MKHCELKVVDSSLGGGILSLRGPKGRGQGDPIHPHITKSFTSGDEVIVILKSDFERLLNKVKSK